MRTPALFILLLATLFAHGQITPADSIKNDKPFEAGIFMQSLYRGDSVILRWAPETPGAWHAINAKGYVIERAPLNDDGSFDPASFLKLTAEPVKPWPLERWATIAGQNSKDDFAKIAAQALYGKNFVPVSGFVGKADEYANRYSFAMLSADLSPATARALGLRYADRTVEKGKSYVYKIVGLTDTTRYKVSASVVIVHANDPQPVPPVVIDHVKEREKVIELYWNRDFHNPYFSAYYIERSDDNGKNFARLNAAPFVHAVSEKIPATVDFFVYTDSIKTNYRNFKYRVIGITPFGELSPPSAVVTAMGRDRTPPMAPANVKTQHLGDSKIKITWEYPKNSKDIKGFLIGRGNNPAKQFIPLTTEPLPAKTREFIDNGADVLASNYYIVAAVDTADNASVSLAQYAMMIDSIPPAPPTNLTGTIDTTGVVTVKWKLGPEPDIQGYLVFFSNHPDHEFSQLTHNPLQDTVFQDTITLKTLTKKIYYRVVAIDYNSNYSKFSGILELKRPDVVPPSGAVMDHYKITEKGIELTWVPSTSEDLAKTILYRMDEKDKAWRAIATFNAPANIHTYTDTTGLQAKKTYTYSLVCFDEDGLSSKRSVPIKLKVPDLTSKQSVSSVEARTLAEEKSILVTWNYPVKGEYRFIIYRAVNGSAFSSYKTVSGSISTFKDKEIKKGSSYEYSVGVVFKDGKRAPYGTIAKTTF